MEHPRRLLPRFVSPDLCQELTFIHRSCSTVGYRPCVLSTTLSHLIATNSAHLILPFVSLRERLKETVEGFFGYEYQLFVEFTGLISWCKGSSIGWHSDDNRSYLKQRDFAAVCYLNSSGEDFQGGNFHFQAGEPKTIVPMAGDVLIYTADGRNIHSVDEIIDGERITLTLWFTLDRKHDEDAKLLMLLSSKSLMSLAGTPDSFWPLPAPENMYWFLPDASDSDSQRGFDIRLARITNLGWSLCTRTHTNEGNIDFTTRRIDESPLKLDQPCLLARGDELLEIEFHNSLHALQILQFSRWYVSDRYKAEGVIHLLSKGKSTLKLATRKFNCLASGDDSILAGSFLAYISETKNEGIVDWANISAAFVLWEHYVQNLQKRLHSSLPHWLTEQCIFCTEQNSNVCLINFFYY